LAGWMDGLDWIGLNWWMDGLDCVELMDGWIGLDWIEWMDEFFPPLIGWQFFLQMQIGSKLQHHQPS
jgi:hypothetical protein